MPPVRAAIRGCVAIASVAVAVVGTGCAECPVKGSTHLSRRVPPGSATICAFGLPGVRTSVQDTQGGVDVTLATVGDATELRKRVHDVLEDRHEPGAWRLKPEHERIARKLRAQIIDEPHGLLVRATPIDPSDLVEIRTAIHDRVEKATSNECQ